MQQSDISCMTSPGLVGMLLTDRDAHLVRDVLFYLDKALVPLRANGIIIDMIVSLRPSDIKSHNVCISSIPLNLRNFQIKNDYEYDAIWTNEYHTDNILNSICYQRNSIRSYAKQWKYKWLFFLDSDIFLNEATLLRLLTVPVPCIGAPYQPRWSNHVAIGLSTGRNLLNETQLQFLINPHLLSCTESSFPCAIIGLGATLIREDILDVEFCIDEIQGGVKGEDIGWCLSLTKHLSARCKSQFNSNTEQQTKKIDNQKFHHFNSNSISIPNFQFIYSPHCLSNHSVRHLPGGSHINPFIPFLSNEYPLLSHIRSSQLFWLENNWLELSWKIVFPPVRIGLDDEFPEKNPYHDCFFDYCSKYDMKAHPGSVLLEILYFDVFNTISSVNHHLGLEITHFNTINENEINRSQNNNNNNENENEKQNNDDINDLLTNFENSISMDSGSDDIELIYQCDKMN